MNSYLSSAHQREIFFGHSEKNIIKCYLASGLNVFDFKTIGCHSIARLKISAATP
jgi:hypothetical protein